MENLARHIIRASFSQEGMTYLPEESRIIYHSKDNRQEKDFEVFFSPKFFGLLILSIVDRG
jgi:hypothetical protein